MSRLKRTQSERVAPSDLTSGNPFSKRLVGGILSHSPLRKGAGNRNSSPESSDSSTPPVATAAVTSPSVTPTSPAAPTSPSPSVVTSKPPVSAGLQKKRANLVHSMSFTAKDLDPTLLSNLLSGYTSHHGASAHSNRFLASRESISKEHKRREAVWDLFQSEIMFLVDHLMVLKHVSQMRRVLWESS